MEQQQQQESNNIIENKSNLNTNDIKINFEFTLEDINGEQVKVKNGMIFKSALEPGLITSVAKRIESTLGAIGEDYFLLLLREYLNNKMNSIYKAQIMSSQISVNEDTKYVADGVTEVVPDEVKNDSDVNNGYNDLAEKPSLEIE